MEEEKKQEPQNEGKQVVDINLTKKEKQIAVLVFIIVFATIFLAVAFVITVIKGDVFTSICNAVWLFIAIQWFRTINGIKVHLGNFIAVIDDNRTLSGKVRIQEKLIKNQEELIALYKEKNSLNAEAMKNMAEQLQEKLKD